ncbi:MAG: PilZ domain-containing protein [Treponema sp.]|jgi:hypothetical protein|nr:PilZ domain-containing protein [Treponema sp.]
MRKNTRYAADAEVHISPFPEREIALKDISLSGCRVHSDDFLEILPNTRFMIDVTPRESADLEDFALDVKSRWVRASKDSFETGLEILAREKDMTLEQYVEFLAKRPS